ncbi:MAG: FAD:protein FMN transferase [Chitinophagales bacterium]
MRLFYFIVLLSMLLACKQEKNADKYINISGHTMGTNYAIQYKDSLQRNFKTELDSLLKLVNRSMSTYDPKSVISTFNNSRASVFEVDSHFANVFEISKKLFALTDGYFNPTVFPLVKYWGFAGGAKPENPDSVIVDSLLRLCDFSALQLMDSSNSHFIYRSRENITLDFSAVAKGYGVDLLSQFLENNSIENYLIEIGGEVRFNGINPNNDKWSVGIDDPTSELENRKLIAILKDRNSAIATSGNYRNYYERKGKLYAHILNPRTGYSEQSSILSATVLAENCAEADALATALMINGKQLFDKISKDEVLKKSYKILLIESGENQLQPVFSNELEDNLNWLKE